MKKNRKSFGFVLRIFCLIVSVAVTAQFIIPKVYAWFLNKNDKNLTITGSVRRTYFERGSGTVDDPYVIARPLQLYYLAWLQDMGIFNQDLDNDRTLDTFYFELGSMNGQNSNENMEIDMSDWTLPPIGTTTYPFVSSFNGNGRTISNLTVSNNENALSDMPTNSTPDTATTNASVLGLFGVVGGYTSTTGYSAPEKSVYDVILEDITIDNTSPVGNQALAGLAAGYVNGVMEDVTVTGTSTINNTSGITAMSFGNDTRTTLSDYALAGYCTEPYRDLLKREDVKVYDPTVEISNLSTYGEVGQGSAWGNSIDMKSMYDRLLGIYTPLENNSSSTARYPSSVLVTIDRTGTSEVRTEEILQLAEDIPTVGGYNIINYNNDYSSYSFIKRTDTHDFMYLYGQSRQQTNRTVSTTTRYVERAYRIHQGNNYLKFNGLIFSNTTTASEATGWIIDSSDRIYTVFQNGNTYTYYFLINDGNKLGYQAVNANAAIPNSVTTWTVDSTSISNNGYYLNYDGTWKLMQQVTITDEPETGNPHFMTVQNATIQNTNTSSDAVKWTKTVVDTVNDKERFTISCKIGNTIYYLTQNEGELELTANAASPTLWCFKAAVHESQEEDAQPAKIYTLIEGDEEGNGYALYYDADEDNWLLTDFMETASGSGIGNDWGVSIPMQEMFTNLKYIKNSLATTSYVASKTVVIDDATGETTERDIVNSTFPTITNNGNTYSRKHYLLNGVGEFTYTDGGDYFMYMRDMQGSSAGTTNIKYVHLLDETEQAHYIKVGNNYLTLNNNHNGFISSNEGNATKWVIDQDGHIYVDLEGATAVEHYYVNVVDGTLTATNTARTTWTYDDTNNRLYCTSSGTTYYLAYGNGWKATTYRDLYYLKPDSNHYLTVENGKLISSQTSDIWEPTANGYAIEKGGTTYNIGSDGTLSGAMFIHDNNGNYLTVSGTSLANTTNQNNAATWYFNGSSSRIFTNINGTNYCLSKTSSNTLELLTNAQNATIWTIDTTNNEISNGEWYVFYNGSQWGLTRKNINVITDGNGNYVRINNNGTPESVTDINNASDFVESNNGNTLTVSVNNSNYVFTVDGNDRIFRASDNKMLYFENGEWRLTEPSYTVITDGNDHYLHLNGTSITNSTDQYTATRWNLTTQSGDYYLSTSINNTIYFLYYSSSIFGSSLTINQTNKTTWKITNNRELYYTSTSWNGNTNYNFLNYTNSWSVKQGQSGAQGNAIIETHNPINNATKELLSLTPVTAFTPNKIPYTPSEIGETTVQLNDTTFRPFTVTPGTEPVGQTYYPLQISVDKNKTGADRFSVNPLNTGYVISGYQEGFGDIRVSQYEIENNISASLKNNNKELDTTKVYTFMGGTKQTLSNYGVNNLVKYAATSSKFNETLATSIANNDRNVYGLHFMNASIGINNLVTAPSVTINETVYENYQMPKDSIDFRLKDKGYINFLAGTYYGTSNNRVPNDSFFSLHRIERGANNEITSIKEILEIYGTGKRRDPYIYKFSDSDYESWSYYKSGNLKEHTVYNSIYELPDGYSSIFNTDWIKTQSLSLNYVYYFEIPTDAGEYALGSVNGGTGAYLLYLDIGTGGSVKAPEGNAKFSEFVPAAVNKTETTLTYEETSTATTPVSLNSYPTYFPLTLNSDETGVSDANTGYVVSGANHTTSSPQGDIRVSRYDRDPYIINSLTNGSLDNRKILTIGTNGQQTLTQYGIDRFYKYQTAKSQLQETLDAGNGSIYGLHFMNAEISTSHLVTLPSATINGQTYANYTVPEDSIDFTLRSQGYINFFAGTYFSGSNVQCFFSLHQVFRNEQNEITEIKEIKEIYKNSDGTYTYRYDGESAPSSGTKVFDTAWLTNPSNIQGNTVYYFEIPVNAGEYALGSVSGKNGAYLLYLDISTHQGDSLLTREKMEIITTTYLLPTGVRFSDDEYKAYIIPITQTGAIEIVSEESTVTSDPALSDTSTSETRFVDTVTITDYAGTLVVQRITEGNNVTYSYGTDTEHLTASTAQVCSRYFVGTAPNTVILQYYYYPDSANTVLNTASSTYTIEDEIIITAYNVTASAASAALTATVTAFDTNKSYLTFQNRSDLAAGDTVTIPTRSP
jgi:hypothetical protein